MASWQRPDGWRTLQGPQRARLAFETGRAFAKARGWEFNWRFVSRPGVGHNLLQMFAGALAYDVVFNETP